MPFEEIRIRNGATIAAVAPARGALASSLAVGGRELLYMDRATFEDPARNVRGGIPFLFPFCGKLEADRFLPAGTTIGQHGFARERAWEIESRADEALALALKPDDASRAVYPYAFHLRQTFRALPRGIEIALEVRNQGSGPMPVSPGWHPYFNCPAERKPEVRGDLPGFDPSRVTNAETFDFGVSTGSARRARFTIPDLGELEFHWSGRMGHFQFWSPAGADFICIEPFAGAKNSINGPDRIEIAPGAAETFSFRLESL